MFLDELDDVGDELASSGGVVHKATVLVSGRVVPASDSDGDLDALGLQSGDLLVEFCRGERAGFDAYRFVVLFFIFFPLSNVLVIKKCVSHYQCINFFIYLFVYFCVSTILAVYPFVYLRIYLSIQLSIRSLTLPIP